jgi:hypothetical protein
MGWWSKTWKKVKNVFKKVTKVVKKVVKAVGKTAKKVWNKVKGVAKKFSKGVSKLGPFANIAMNFIPGFGQLWSAYGIWGQLAKGAVTGFALSGGSAQGALLGAATMGAADIFKNMPGEGIAGKVGEWFKGWTDSTKIGKAFGDSISKFKDAFGLDKGPTFGDKYKNLAKDYTGRIGADTTNLPPSQRGLYANSAPSVESIQGAYQANLDNGMSHEAIMKSFNAQGASDAAWWKANPPPSSLLDKVKDAIPDMSKIDPMNSAQATAGMWSPDTSPLNSVGANAAAGETHNQFGFGKDANEKLIRDLGLVPLLQQYQANIAT